MLYDSFIASLYWMPFVLAIGITYSYLKIIDISVDGVIVISGICAVLVWNYTNNYFFGVIAGIIVGGFSSVIFAVLVHYLNINNLIAGIVFSLFCYSLSVLIIGESLVIHTDIISNYDLNLYQVIFADFLLIIFVTWFYKTRIGVVLRAISDRAELRIPINKNIVYLIGHFLTGLMLGIGSVLYVQWEGIARAGGGFDYLLTGLTSFIVSERVVNFFHKKLCPPKKIYLSRFVSGVISSLIIKVILGTYIFQFLLYFIIYNSPFPQIWKLFFALLLVAALAQIKLEKNVSKEKTIVESIPDNYLWCKDIRKIFNNNNESHLLFCNSSIRIGKGLNVVIGENGVGKTTFLKCISGSEKLTSGEIFLNDYRVDHMHKDSRPFFLLNQNPHANLAPGLLVYENIDTVVNAGKMPLSIVKVEKVYKEIKKDIKYLFDDIDLNLLLRKSSFLSGGEAQYISFIMTVMADYQVILADEPTANLDEFNRIKVIYLLKVLAERKIVIVASHDKELIAVANNKILIKNKNISTI
jgi:putative ABC transport system ATP-binding protein